MTKTGGTGKNLKSGKGSISVNKNVILLIEDEEKLSRTLAEYLELNGYRVLRALNGLEGLSMFYDHMHEVDLILLDIMLRGSSGFEVAEFVRSNRLDCKIIILTAYHEFDFASKALSMDLQDYLLKPVRPSVLLQRVRDVLHLSSPARAATGLAVWPYLACGISSPLPPIPNLLPNMTVVGILRDGTDREVISQINLALQDRKSVV